MSDYNNNSNTASSSQGTAAVTLSAITTGLLALGGANGGNGLLSGIFGGNASAQNEICNLRMQNAILTSEASSGEKINKGLTEVYTELRKQDKLQDQNLANLNSRVLALETAAPLKEQIVDGKFAAVYDKITCCCNSATAAISNTNASLASLQSLVGNLTKTIIPIDNVCPQPMQRYNSWTAPTTPTTAG